MQSLAGGVLGGFGRRLHHLFGVFAVLEHRRGHLFFEFDLLHHGFARLGIQLRRIVGGQTDFSIASKSATMTVISLATADSSTTLTESC